MLLSHRLAAVSLLGLVTAIAGCTSEVPGRSSTSGPEISSPDAIEPTTWTIFVYGHGDHNLSPSLANDILKMSKADLGESVNVLVLADWNASAKDEDGNPIYASGSEWYRIRGGGLEPELLRTEPEQDLDDPATLSGAIARAFRDYPADRYGLVLWDHGGSWDGGYGSDTQDGTRPRPEGMSVPKVARAVRDGLAAAGLDGARSLELLAFDTCLMGGAEVAYAMKDLAKVYVANAEIDYGSGLNYADVLTYIAKNLDASPEELARNEVKSWDALHATAGADDALLRSHIAIDTTKLEAFASATASFAEAVASAPNAAERIASSAYFALPAYHATLAEGVSDPRYRDYGQLLAAISGDTSLGAIAGAASEVRLRLGEMTIGSVGGALREEQAGFHVAFPIPKTLSAGWFGAYSQLASEWAKTSRWDAVLQSMFTNRDSTPPQLTTEIVGTDAAGQTTLSILSADRDIGIARLSLLGADPAEPETAIRFGLVAASALAAGEAGVMRWDGKGVAVEGQLASVVPWMMTGRDATGRVRPPVVAVLGKLSFGGEEMSAGLLCAEGDDTAEVITLVTATGQTAALTMAEIVADDPSATFAPGLVARPASGDASVRAGTPIVLREEGLSVASKAVPAGDYSLRIEADDVWGNTAAVEHTVSVGK